MIVRAFPWPDNAHLIADVARLNLLPNIVLDVTWGLGNFWTEYQPRGLVGCDIDPARSPVGYPVDCRNTPFQDGQFGTVVIDLPYRYAGTRDRGEFDDRYGLKEYATADATDERIRDAITEAARISAKNILVKCQDQVVSGHVRWQTHNFTNHAEGLGLRLEHRFDMLFTPRSQPPGREVKTEQSNYSTLLVFTKRGRTRSTGKEEQCPGQLELSLCA